jgi:hypothetical protein
MRWMLVLMAVLSSATLRAQSTNAPQTNVAPVQVVQPLQTETSKPSLLDVPLLQYKANEIVKDNIVFSGIAVELLKKRNPLQLINPRAPAEFGSPEDNVVRDPMNGKVQGLKIFAIRF